MKAIDYINSLIKERDDSKELCKTHVETIRLLKREIIKKDKKNSKLEKELSNNIKYKKEFDKIKIEVKSLKEKYEDLQYMYNGVVEENDELKSILNNLERMCDSDNN